MIAILLALNLVAASIGAYCAYKLWRKEKSRGW
jgi:hypothetical protein